MDQKTVAFIVIGMIAFVIGGSEALTCYSCNSTSAGGPKNCLDPFSATGVSKCTGTTCVKGWAKAQGVTAVFRGCNPTPVDKDQCVDASGEGFSAKGCVCRSDYCNDAGILKPTYKMLVAVATVMAITWVNKI